MFNERILSMQITSVFWLASSKMCPPLTRGNVGTSSFAPGLPSGLKSLLIVDLFSVYLLFRVNIVNCYIEVDFTFGLLDYVRCIEEFVILRFYSIHFTVTLAGTQDIVHYIKDFVKQRFHCLSLKEIGKKQHYVHDIT